MFTDTNTVNINIYRDLLSSISTITVLKKIHFLKSNNKSDSKLHLHMDIHVRENKKLKLGRISLLDHAIEWYKIH